MFSPNEKLFDLWNFRMCFYDPNENTPYFIVGYENGEAVGILPLYFDKAANQYAYFGGWFPERNTFYIKDKKKLPQFLERCPNNTLIEGIDPHEKEFYNFLDDEYTYYLDLNKHNLDFESYFSSLDKRKRKDIRRDLRNIPEYKLRKGAFYDFDRLIELNVRQYGDESKFNNMAIRNGIQKMERLAHESGIAEMISVDIAGKTEAVEFGIFLGDWYYAIIGGANNQKISNLGKLMNVLSIKNAMEKKANFMDFFATSGYWKNMWNFDKAMLLKFIK